MKVKFLMKLQYITPHTWRTAELDTDYLKTLGYEFVIDTELARLLLNV